MKENVKNVYEYMLLYLVYDYIVNQSTDKENSKKVTSYMFNQFNSNNDFSLEKRRLLPFLVTIGNGKKSELLKTFYPFIITKSGFVSDVVTGINDSRIFDFDTEVKLLIKPEFLEKINEETDNKAFNLLNSKHNYFINVIDPVFKKINDISDELFISDYKDNFEYIRVSIDNINRKIPNFANEKLSDVIYWSKLNKVYFENKSKFIDDTGARLPDIKPETKLKLNLAILIHDFDLQLRRQFEFLHSGERIIDIYNKFKKEVEVTPAN